MELKILKCHGSGNDFILIDELSETNVFSEDQRIRLAQQFCDRSGGLGADGILFVQESKRADAGMRIFNADGSEAEMCGNGMRCVGRYVSELLKKDELVIETMKADIEVSRVADLLQGVKTFEVMISPVSLQTADLPLTGYGDTLFNERIKELSDDLLFTAVSIPNPHIISIVDTIDDDVLSEIAQEANTNKNVFPQGVNVSFVRIVDPDTIFVRTYERGVGLTNACGTAMSASSLVACMLGHNRAGREIHVINRGAMVKCVVLEDTEYKVKLIGNATYVYGSTVEVDPVSFSIQSKSAEEPYTEDAASYDRLVIHTGEFGASQTD